MLRVGVWVWVEGLGFRAWGCGELLGFSLDGLGLRSEQMVYCGIGSLLCIFLRSSCPKSRKSKNGSGSVHPYSVHSERTVQPEDPKDHLYDCSDLMVSF